MRCALPAVVGLLWIALSLPGFAQEQGATLKELAHWVATRFPAVEGRISAVDPEEVGITLGSRHGLAPGMRLNAFRQGKPFRHPLTGEILGYRETDLGKVVLTKVETDHSQGQRLHTTEELKPGDGVRTTAARIPLALIPTSPTIPRHRIEALSRFLEATGRFRLLKHQTVVTLLVRNQLASLEPLDAERLETLERVFPDQTLLLLSRGEESDTGGKSPIHYQLQLQLVYPGSREAFAAVQTTLAGTPEPSPSGAMETPFFALERKDPMAVHPLRVKAQHVAWVDLDGDRHPELAVSTGRRVILYRYSAAGLQRLWQEPSVQGHRHTALSVMDVDGDGRDDLVVGSLRWEWPKSYMVVWKDGAFRTVGPFPVHLRATPVPGAGDRLMGAADLEPGTPIYRYTLENNELQRGDLLRLPGSVKESLYNFALLGVEGRTPHVLVLDAEGNLRLHGPSGQTVWEVRETYTGYGTFVGDVFVANALRVLDLDGDGLAVEVILGKNIATIDFFEELKGYREGELHALRWTGKGMERLWEVVAIEGFLTGFAMFPEAPGESAKVMVTTVPTLFSVGASLEPAKFRRLVAGWGSLRAYLIPRR